MPEATLFATATSHPVLDDEWDSRSVQTKTDKHFHFVTPRGARMGGPLQYRHNDSGSVHKGRPPAERAIKRTLSLFA